MDKGMHKVKTGIYKLHIDDYFYIGRANNIRTRAKQHMKQMEYMIRYKKADGAGNKKMLSYFLAHPDCDRIRIEILEECSTSELQAKEQSWLDKHKDDPKIFNIATYAAKTTADAIRQEFTPGIYKIEYAVHTIGEYFEYKSMLKDRNIVSSGIVREF